MKLLVLSGGRHPYHESTPILSDVLRKAGHAVTITADAAEGTHPWGPERRPKHTPGGTFPLGWTWAYGDGKVCVLLLGHDGRSFQTPAFQQLVLNGVDWATAPSA